MDWGSDSFDFGDGSFNFGTGVMSFGGTAAVSGDFGSPLSKVSKKQNILYFIPFEASLTAFILALMSLSCSAGVYFS